GDPGASRSSRGVPVPQRLLRRLPYAAAGRQGALCRRAARLCLAGRVPALLLQTGGRHPARHQEALRPPSLDMSKLTSPNKKPPDCSGGFFTSIFMPHGLLADTPPAP